MKVADLRDIGCMKISAISSRATKKDFIDLYFLCQKGIPLRRLLELFKKKYKSCDYNMMHILKKFDLFCRRRKRSDAKNNSHSFLARSKKIFPERNSKN